ncbi:MAG: hypothetical protein JXJ04_24465 [Spirochaetales bacterium]|nr:hypothetical protein [Spirochaetales bacterium]
MKKKLNYLEVTENQENLENSAGVDPKRYAAIQRGNVNYESTFLSLFYRPRFVDAIVALF